MAIHPESIKKLRVLGFSWLAGKNLAIRCSPKDSCHKIHEKTTLSLLNFAYRSAVVVAVVVRQRESLGTTLYSIIIIISWLVKRRPQFRLLLVDKLLEL